MSLRSRRLLGGASGFEVSKVEFSEEDVSKGDYPHYMLKEIYEQPATIQDAMRGRLSREEATREARRAGDDSERTARGRAHHPHRLRHREPRGDGRRIYHRGARARARRGRVRERVSLPQSCRCRRTRSSFASARAARPPTRSRPCARASAKGHRTLGICNNVASTIARESDGGVYMHAGPEIGVAATKSFTSQVTILTLIGAAARPHPASQHQRRPARSSTNSRRSRTRSRASSNRATTSRRSRKNMPTRRR